MGRRDGSPGPRLRERGGDRGARLAANSGDRGVRRPHPSRARGVGGRGAPARSRSHRRASERRGALGLEPEVLVDHRHDVAQRPLLARVGASGPVPHHSSEPWESLACSEPCEPPPTWCGAAPVEELVAGLGRHEHLAGRAAAQRRPHAPERVRDSVAEPARRRARPGRAARGRPRRSSAARAGPRARRAGAKRSSATLAGARRAGSPPRRPGGRSSASRGRRPRARAACARTRGEQLARGGRGRARRPAPSASSGRPRSRRSSPAPPGWQHAEPVERARSRSISCSTCDCEWSRADDHRVVLEERVGPAGRRASGARSAGRRRRSRRPARTARSCASACRCRAARAAGSRTGRARPGSAPTQPACWSRTPGSPSCERHAGAARGEDVGVEELARPVDGVAEDRRARAASSAVSAAASWRWRPRYIR